MMFSRCYSLLLAAVFLLTCNIYSQTSPTESVTDKEKIQKGLEKRVLQMLDQAVGDADSLKLAQNRAIIDAIAGDLYWKFDEKHARELFRNAGNEIIAANAETEKDKKNEDNPFYSAFDFSDVRREVLPLIAKHDADLALELLVQTRPAKLAEMLAKNSQPNAKQSSGGFFDFDPQQYRVQQEIALEQQFAVLAAEQNPDKAIKLIKDSLAKGVSWNVLPLLQKLNQKNEKKATALADDVVKKIADTDLMKKRDDLSVAVRFLQTATDPNKPKNPKEKQFNFTDAQLKEIANKLFDTFINSNSIEMTMLAMQAMAGLEKYIPEKIGLLKQKQAEESKNLPPEFKNLQQRQKLWNPNSTPEEIFAELPKLNEYDKEMAYQSLARKIGQIDDEARARKLIEQIPDEKARNNAAEQFESAKINRAAKDGKLDEAKKLIGNLNKKKTQIQKLVALATQFYKKGGEENINSAVNLMKDAKALANEYPEDEDELNDLMELVKGYAVINPDEAFRLFEPIVDQISDIVQASAILSKYNRRNQSFKKGELLLKTGGYSWDGQLLFRYNEQIQLLGKADLNRMSALSDRFTRTDARTMVKLFIAQGFLKSEKEDGNNEGTGGGGIVIID